MLVRRHFEFVGDGVVPYFFHGFEFFFVDESFFDGIGDVECIAFFEYFRANVDVLLV